MGNRQWAIAYSPHINGQVLTYRPKTKDLRAFAAGGFERKFSPENEKNFLRENGE